MKERDLNRIEKGLDNVQRVMPDLLFLDRAERAINTEYASRMQISNLQVWAIAASLALLLLANFFLLNEGSDTQSLSDLYNLIPTKSPYNG